MAENPTTLIQIPNDITDILSGDLLSVPEPNFVFARWAMAAATQAQMAQADPDAWDLVAQQLREFRITDRGSVENMVQAMHGGMGGSLGPLDSMVYPELVKMVREAKGPGESIRMNRPRFIDGATTIANRRMTSTQLLFGTSQPLGMDQTSVTIEKVGGPGDSAGTPTPVSVELFAQDRTRHDLLALARMNLKRDRFKFLDDRIINLGFTAASAVSDGTVYGGGAASATAFTAAGNEPMSFDLFPQMAERLRGRNVTGLNGGQRWPVVMHHHQFQQLENDAAYQRLARYYPERSPLFPGYQTSVGSFDICVSTRMPTGLGGAGSTITTYKGLVIAPEALGWALARDAWAVRDKNDDGGMFARFAWVAFEGWQALDDRYFQAVITD